MTRYSKDHSDSARLYAQLEAISPAHRLATLWLYVARELPGEKHTSSGKMFHTASTSYEKPTGNEFYTRRISPQD